MKNFSVLSSQIKMGMPKLFHDGEGGIKVPFLVSSSTISLPFQRELLAIVLNDLQQFTTVSDFSVTDSRALNAIRKYMNTIF